MPLEKYNSKRDFNETSEPTGGKETSDKLIFVVQRHHASHLHYDFRLQLNGVLLSWAVPKGPSLNPEDKRLAMMVEDHPIDYAGFSGTIPHGQYGGGTVSIFDKGWYTSLEGKGNNKSLETGLKAGNLKFVLHGKILKGEFALVKLKNGKEDNAWLLIKHNDKYALHESYSAEDHVAARVKQAGIKFAAETKSSKAKSSAGSTAAKSAKAEKPEPAADEPPPFKPMLATLAKHLVSGDDYIFERKFDGYRIGALIHNGKVTFTSRNGLNYTARYAGIARQLAKLKHHALLDGEMVMEDKDGIQSFSAIQDYNEENGIPAGSFKLVYYIFDLLYLHGNDLTSMPLYKRKALLSSLITNTSSVQAVETFTNGEQLFSRAQENNWEGIISKNINGKYLPGKRTDSWLKHKIAQQGTALIVGYTQPQGSRSHFGSLILARPSGNGLIYMGNCGTGFNQQRLESLSAVFKPVEGATSPFNKKIPLKAKPTWLSQYFPCLISYTEITNSGHFRHPVFMKLTDEIPSADKADTKGPVKKTSASKVGKDTAVVKSVPHSKAAAAKTKTSSSPSADDNKGEYTFGRIKVPVTNLTKVFWPQEGYTKGDLISYYAQAADYILPYIKNKPLSLNRHPNGITGSSFFQKDMDTEHLPSFAKTHALYSESNDKNIDYLICNNPQSLIYMVNLGVIEINPWLSTYTAPDEPVYAVLDIDPHDIEFKHSVDVANKAHEILTGWKVPAFIKTSGSKGLHIFIPLTKGHTYEQSKNFIQYLASLIHAEYPDTTSLERSPSKRKNKIYLDFLQNRRGQTIAAPYSVRPKPGATVSMPLPWDKIDYNLKLSDYTINNALDIAASRTDPWADIKKGINLAKVKLK